VVELGGRVQDKVVIVTGGAGGIGSAACRAIAAEGGRVVVADSDATRARAVADGIAADGGIAESVGVDVTNRVQVQAMIGTAVDSFGELNVIFNNAGMNRPRGFMDVDESNFVLDGATDSGKRQLVEVEARTGLETMLDESVIDPEAPTRLGPWTPRSSRWLLLIAPPVEPSLDKTRGADGRVYDLERHAFADQAVHIRLP